MGEEVISTGCNIYVYGVDPSDTIADGVSWDPIGPGSVKICRECLEWRGEDRLQYCATPMLRWAHRVVALLAIAVSVILVVDGFNGYMPGVVSVFVWMLLVLPSIFLPCFLRCYEGGFDKGRGVCRVRVRKGHTVNKQWCEVGLDQIHALQLIGKQVENLGKTYELNLVLKDSSRVSVLEHENIIVLERDALRLSSFLCVPVWRIGSYRCAGARPCPDSVYRLFEQVQAFDKEYDIVTEGAVPVEERLEGVAESDLLAGRVSWEEAGRSPAGEISFTRSDGQFVVLSVYSSLFLGIFGFVLGCVILCLMAYAKDCDFVGITTALIFMLFGLFFTLIPDARFTFDRKRNLYWKGRGLPMLGEHGLSRRALSLDSIHAIQIVKIRLSAEKARGLITGPYRYGLYVVHNDGCRRVVATDARENKVRRTAKHLADFLGVPVWRKIRVGEKNHPCDACLMHQR